jgi:hypothetical protein
MLQMNLHPTEAGPNGRINQPKIVYDEYGRPKAEDTIDERSGRTISSAWDVVNRKYKN